MTTYTKKALKGASIFFIMSIAAGFMGYLVRLALARNLTKAEYGLFYAVFALFGMLSLFRDLGVGQALIKYIAESNVRKRYGIIKGLIIITFLSQIAASLLVCIVIFFFSKEIAIYLFHTEEAVVIMLLLAVMFILMPIEKIISFTFQGFHRFDFNSLIEFVRMVVVLFFVLVSFIYSASIVIPCAAYIASYIIETLVFSPLFLRTFPQFFRVRAVLTKELAKKLFLFGLPLMVGLFGSMIMTYTDTLIITYFRTLEEVALYQVAMPTAKLLLYFTGAVSMVVFPISSELWAKNLKKKLQLGISLLYKYSFVFVIPVAMLMIAYPEIIIKVFFGEKYTGASLVLQILAFAGVIYTICFINSNVLSGVGMPKENTKIILIAALFNLILDIILVILIGIEGAALATLISYCILLLLTGLKIKAIIDVHMPWGNWLKNFFAATIFVLVMYYLKSAITIFGDLLEMVVVGAAGFAVYILLLYILKVIDVKEIIGIIKYALKSEVRTENSK